MYSTQSFKGPQQPALSCRPAQFELVHRARDEAQAAAEEADMAAAALETNISEAVDFQVTHHSVLMWLCKGDHADYLIADSAA